MIAKEIPTHPVETQKLVALGKVIDDDDKTLADYKIPDNGIIVLMQTKVSRWYPLQSGKLTDGSHLKATW